LIGETEATAIETNGATTLRAAIKYARANGQLARMLEKTRIVLAEDGEGNETKALVLFARRGSLDAAEESQDAPGKVPLAQHNDDVACEARKIARCLGLPASFQEALELAGLHHDPGKDRAGWQKAIGNPRPYDASEEWKPLAKSDQRGFDDSLCGRYRHEFGSLRQASSDPMITAHPERDLILHLIAAHHGWARPHFKEEHWDIEEGGYDENPAVAAETPRRFARLQRRFGRWGLAWFESLLRAADYRVSSGKVGARQPQQVNGSNDKEPGDRRAA
jgi:CRISPR-associated endonuclease/helicase Cas3